MILIVKLAHKRLDHQPMWAFFKRLLTISDVPDTIWDPQVVDRLKNLKDDHFAAQRNAVHYRNTHWPIPEDLASLMRRADFGQYDHDVLASDHLDPTKFDFGHPIRVDYAAC